MSWFGFGFNGFRQIVPLGEVDDGTLSDNLVKIAVPTAVTLPSECSDRPVSETPYEKKPKVCSIQVTASWSRTASFSVKGNLKKWLEFVRPLVYFWYISANPSYYAESA